MKLVKLEQLAFELCAIPSISYEEQAVVDFVSAWLKNAGLTVQKLPLTHDATRANLFVCAEEKPRYTALLCTHLDTVAPFIKPRLDEASGVLWGRGACDAKGIAAAMIMALLNEREAGFADIALLLTVGEEEKSDGAKDVDKKLKDRAHYVIVGEPTELKAASAQKGSLVFDLYAEGLKAHSALPHLGDSAINKLIRALHELIEMGWPSDPLFGETLLNIGRIEGGFMRNMLADKACAHGIMRSAVPIGDLKRLLQGVLAADLRLDILSSADPFSYIVPQGFDTFVAGFGSDAPYLRSIGKPMLLGPGSLSLAHTDQEHMRLSDLHDGVRAYQRIVSSLRTGDPTFAAA